VTAPAEVELHPSIETVRHGSSSPNSDRLLHLLPRVWTGSQKTRPALCGQRRVTWKAVEQLPTGAAGWPTCEACDDRAAEIAMPRVPVRFAPPSHPTPGRTDDLPIRHTPRQVNTQAARTERRAAFRDSFQHQP